MARIQSSFDRIPVQALHAGLNNRPDQANRCIHLVEVKSLRSLPNHQRGYDRQDSNPHPHHTLRAYGHGTMANER
jgi:hypothetical protein